MLIDGEDAVSFFNSIDGLTSPVCQVYGVQIEIGQAASDIIPHDVLQFSVLTAQMWILNHELFYKLIFIYLIELRNFGLNTSEFDI